MIVPLEDPTELECVRMSMATVLQANTKYALVGIFDQIMGEDENIREKGFEYISGPLMTMKHKLFNQHPEVEEFLYGLIKKVRSLWSCSAKLKNCDVCFPECEC